MKKYFVELYTDKPISGNYRMALTEPTDAYMTAVKQYEDIVASIKNKSVISDNDIPYNNGHYAPHFDVSLIAQDYQHGSFGGNKITVKGGLETYIGEVPEEILQRCVSLNVTLH